MHKRRAWLTDKVAAALDILIWYAKNGRERSHSISYRLLEDCSTGNQLIWTQIADNGGNVEVLRVTILQLRYSPQSCAHSSIRSLAWEF